MYRIPALIVTSLFMALLFVQCEKEQESEILLFVEPDINYISIHSQERIDFNIKSTSSNEIEIFKIGSKSSEYATDYFYDTLIQEKSFEINYTFKTPENYEKDEMTIVFYVSDTKNNEAKLAKKILIIKEDTLLNETTGHTLYSHLSEKADGYDLINNNPVYTSYDDPSKIHIYDASEDSLHGEDLSRRWETMTDVKFVIYNDYDYANATNLSIKNAYESGVKKEFVPNIQTEDIIIANINESRLVAIKILDIFDADSTQNDRYIFNMKK